MSQHQAVGHYNPRLDTRPQSQLDDLDVEADAAELAGDMAGATDIRVFRAEFSATPMGAS